MADIFGMGPPGFYDISDLYIIILIVILLFNEPCDLNGYINLASSILLSMHPHLVQILPNSLDLDSQSSYKD